MNLGSLKSVSTLFAATAMTLTATLAMAAGVSEAEQEANRQTVLTFYEKGLNQKDADAAAAYLGDRYVQHNPSAPDGVEGFRKFVAFMKEKFPKSRSEIKRSFTDGEYVILHVHSIREPGERGNAIIDIFKLEKGKIVEHWDVTQPIPEKAANNNTMF